MLWAPSALPTQWKVTQPRNGEDNNLRPVMEIRNIREPRLLIVFCIRLFLFCFFDNARSAFLVLCAEGSITEQAAAAVVVGR